MAKKNVNTFTLKELNRDQALKIVDKFPDEPMFSTFVKKVTMFVIWPMIGLWDGKDLAAVICWKFTKSKPKTASIQILYTFNRYRKMGCAKRLCQEFFRVAKANDAIYFRISSEIEAQEFYEKLGVTFVGTQKSGCLLTVGKLGRSFSSSTYDLKDPIIHKAVYRRGKGGCVSVFKNKRSVPIERD